MRIVLTAVDVGPCKNLELVARALKELGAEISCFLGNGKTDVLEDPGLVEKAVTCDVLVSGMSSTEEGAQAELKLLTIAGGTAQRVLFADTFSVVNRPAFHAMRTQCCDLVFVPDEQEIALAHGDKDNLVACGVPLWDEFFPLPHVRKEARETLGFYDDFHVLVAGGKSRAINEELFDAALVSLAGAVRPAHMSCKIHLALHPGDKTDPSAYKMYGEVESCSRFASSYMLTASDLLISSYSTLSIEAACKGMPSVDYISPAALERFRNSTGTTEWPPITRGLTDAAYTVGQLKRMITGAIYSADRTPRFEVQPGSAKRIAEKILALG